MYRSGRSQQEELIAFLKTCRADLESIETQLSGFRPLQTHEPRGRDELKFSPKTTEIKARITMNSDRLNRFLNGLHTDASTQIKESTERHVISFGDIGNRLNDIYQEVIAGRRDASIITDMDSWATLKQEIIDDDITEVDVETNRDEIELWLEQVKKRTDMDDVLKEAVGMEESQTLTPRPVGNQLIGHDKITHLTHVQEKQSIPVLRHSNWSSKQATVEDYHSEDNDSTSKQAIHNEQEVAWSPTKPSYVPVPNEVRVLDREGIPSESTRYFDASSESENDEDGTAIDIILDENGQPTINQQYDEYLDQLTQPDWSDDENSDGQDQEDGEQSGHEENDNISIISSYTDYNNHDSVIHPDADDNDLNTPVNLMSPPAVVNAPSCADYVGECFCKAVAQKTDEWGIEPDASLTKERMQAIFTEQNELMGIRPPGQLSEPRIAEDTNTQDTDLDYVIYRHEIEHFDRPIDRHEVSPRDLFDDWYRFSYLPSKPSTPDNSASKSVVVLRHAYWYPKHLDISLEDVLYGSVRHIKVIRGSHNPFTQEGSIEIGFLQVSVENGIYGKND